LFDVASRIKAFTYGKLSAPFAFEKPKSLQCKASYKQCPESRAESVSLEKEDNDFKSSAKDAWRVGQNLSVWRRLIREIQQQCWPPI